MWEVKFDVISLLKNPIKKSHLMEEKTLIICASSNKP